MNRKNFLHFGVVCLVLFFNGSFKVFAIETNNPPMIANPDKEQKDSLPSYLIDEITITGNAGNVNHRSVTPVQTMDEHRILETNSLMVSDAVKFFSGAIVKDYGGMGGMKSLSVRNLGAQHTAVAYDGITLTDCQTGQIDIGRYSIDNVELLSLNIGDGNTIFQPARMFASSGLLSIRTKKPDFSNGKNYHGTVGFKYGSFGLINPDAFFELKLNDNFDFNVSAEGLEATGNYPYRLYYGNAENAYTTETRNNGEVNAIRLESTLFGRFKKEGKLEVKSYYYQSSRGLPGAVILYNPYASQHLWDKAGFLQGHFEQELTHDLSFQANAKYNKSWQRYFNPDYLGSEGIEDHRYEQDEIYLSASLMEEPLKGLAIALSTDWAVNKMESTLYEFANPSRYTMLANLSAKYENKILIATAGLLGTVINEETIASEPASDLFKMSPSFNISVKPYGEAPFRIRFFYKESFRVPSFNDLYYSAVGNLNLKPENNKQLNLGLTGSIEIPVTKTLMNFSADGYKNLIIDKIMAMPTKNIFIWSMVNLGKVDITGIDIALDIRQKVGRKYVITAGWNHSYQRALDLTSPEAAEYKNQIAYAPRVYGSGRIGFSTPFGKLAYAIIWSGHRYVTGHNIIQNDLPGYSDQSVSFDKTLSLQKYKVNLRAEILNLMNENYEIVRNFPMPGRSFRLSFKLEI